MGGVDGITREGRDRNYFRGRVEWGLESVQICGVKERTEPKTIAVPK